MNEEHIDDYDPMTAGFDTVPSVQTIPASWSFTIGIGSRDWFTICFYRWYLHKADELMESWTCEWSLRQFWRVRIEP